MWHKPVRVGNDADVAGYGAIKGKGVELVLTLGTGMGAALFTNGHLVPGLELGHHPWMKKTYEDYLGRRGLDKFGKNRWNTFVLKGIKETEKLFNWDHLYIGGGNTKKLNFKLPPNVSIISNAEGILGGVLLWKDQG
jgi:polyphosphate glucokinase